MTRTYLWKSLWVFFMVAEKYGKYRKYGNTEKLEKVWKKGLTGMYENAILKSASKGADFFRPSYEKESKRKKKKIKKSCWQPIELMIL